MSRKSRDVMLCKEKLLDKLKLLFYDAAVTQKWTHTRLDFFLPALAGWLRSRNNISAVFVITKWHNGSDFCCCSDGLSSENHIMDAYFPYLSDTTMSFWGDKSMSNVVGCREDHNIRPLPERWAHDSRWKWGIYERDTHLFVGFIRI